MKLFSKLFSAMLICSLLLLPACGGDDDNSLSVDKGKALSALSASEAQEICEYAAKLMAGAVTMEQMCVQASVMMLAMSGKEACDAAYQSCMNPTGGQGDPTNYDCGIESGMTDCEDATVQDALDCFDGLVAQQKQIANMLSGLSCNSSVEDLAALEGLSEMDEPAACQALDEKCPSMGD